MKTIKFTEKDILPTIHDLPEAVKPEFIVDFHARFPVSLKEKLLEASERKGMKPNRIVNLAVEAFLK